MGLLVSIAGQLLGGGQLYGGSHTKAVPTPLIHRR